jgi:hypothetical protein
MKNTTRLPLGRNSKPLRSRAIPWAPLLLAPAWLACGSEAGLPVENLGNTSDLRAGVAAEPMQPSGAVTPATGRARLNGHWTGLTKQPFIEVDGEPSNYTFPSGSRSITLDLSFDEDSFISGSIVFGAGSPPPPQAGVAYPPGLDYGLSIVENLPPVEGFSYALAEASPDFETGADEVALLSYERFAALGGWCPLQPSVPEGDGDSTCIGGGGFGGTLTDEGYVCERFLDDGTRQPVDCNMAALCLSAACVCDAEGCSQSDRASHVQVELNGDELTLSFGTTPVDVGLPERELEQLGTVKLTRATNP